MLEICYELKETQDGHGNSWIIKQSIENISQSTSAVVTVKADFLEDDTKETMDFAV